jgi:hypothetical protein
VTGKPSSKATAGGEPASATRRQKGQPSDGGTGGRLREASTGACHPPTRAAASVSAAAPVLRERPALSDRASRSWSPGLRRLTVRSDGAVIAAIAAKAAEDTMEPS